MSSSAGAGRDCPIWGELQGKASAAGQDLQCFLDFPLQKVFTEKVGLDFFQELSLGHTYMDFHSSKERNILNTKVTSRLNFCSPIQSMRRRGAS